MTATFEVMNPVAEVKPTHVMPARRLDSLEGKRIALWWNNKPKGDVALTALGEALEKRFAGLKVIPFFYHDRPMAVTHGPEVYQGLFQTKPDAVIASTGD